MKNKIDQNKLNWRLEVDSDTGKIIRDEQTSEGRWRFMSYDNKTGISCNGAIAKDRETCVKYLVWDFKRDARDMEKKLRMQKRIVKMFSRELGIKIVL